MTTNPYLNAATAASYVALVASILFFGPQFITFPKNVLIPIAMLSLFVLSVITMAVCFFYQPVQLFLAGEKAAATALFLKTVAAFACITVFIFASLLLFSRTSQDVPVEKDGPVGVNAG